MSRLCWADVVERAAVIVTGYDAVGGCTLRQLCTTGWWPKP
jgi:hypothetical protein